MATAKRLCCSGEGLLSSENRTKRLRLEQQCRGKRNAESLLDICAKIVAENIAFQEIEDRIDRIPEPVQSRIVYWSFPRNERDICMYSSFASGAKENKEGQKLPFQQGVKLLDSGAVDKVLQIGFHLSGVVRDQGDSLYAESETSCNVSISFDRCKITSVKCSCGNRDIFWCQHVVALSLYRIRKASSVDLRVPISETLLQMSRQQLQKFAQYLIAQHHTDVLPTAQRLADEILRSNSTINRLPGAPDPTAGASVDDDNSWHLDEDQVREQVKTYLTQGAYYNSTNHLNSMFAKVREMLRVRDSNGARLLTLITQQFLDDPRLLVWRTQATPMTDKCRQLWDELGALWVCVVLNPKCCLADKDCWHGLLRRWAAMHVCPLEEVDGHDPQAIAHGDFAAVDVAGPSASPASRTIFQRALEASQLTWQDPHLQRILRADCCSDADLCDPTRFNSQGLPLWTESIPVACARVDALRSHGYGREALCLAVAVVQSMKRDQHRLERGHSKPHLTAASSRAAYSSLGEGWQGHPLDPIGCLFTTLAEASVTDEESLLPSSDIYNFCIAEPPASDDVSLTYRHVAVPGSHDRHESYLTLALEAALIGLGRQQLMPGGLYSQEKVLKQEQHLIGCLQQLELDATLVTVMKRQANRLLKAGGASSGLGIGIAQESIPMHTFAKFLFTSLLPYDSDLAFKIGLRAIRLPVLEGLEENDASSNNVNRFPHWFTLSHIESQQCSLAATMLSAAKDDALRLRAVLESVQRNVHCSSQLFKLAQDAFKMATMPESTRHQPLLNAGFQLGLQIMRMTLSTLNWRRREMVRWLVTCATEVGVDALVSIMHNWYQLFTPLEATDMVARSIMSPPTLLQLGVEHVKEVSRCARTLALQCATEDPANCALCALNLCAREPAAFDAAYRIVVGAASGAIGSTQLFSIARYLQQRGFARHAHELALRALAGVSLAHDHDTHPAVADVHWACALSHSLGRAHLERAVPLVVHNVRCAAVLADVLRRCSVAPPGGDIGKRRVAVRPLSCDKPPLRALLAAAVRAYVSTTHARLTHISPRHYADFVDFLARARDTFLLAADGRMQFAQLLDNVKLVYKGKKKLMLLVKERFGL